MAIEKWSIGKLSDLSGYKPRQIRYFVQLGFLKPPVMKGRSSIYDETHLAILQRIKYFQEKGLKPFKIKEKLKSEIPEIVTQYELMPGLLMYINSDLEKKRSKLMKLIKVVIDQSGLSKEKVDGQISDIYAQYNLLPGLLVFINPDLENKRPRLMQIIRFVLNSAGLLEDDIE